MQQVCVYKQCGQRETPKKAHPRNQHMQMVRMMKNKKKSSEQVQYDINVEAAATLMYCWNTRINSHQILTALQLHAGLAGQVIFD